MVFHGGDISYARGYEAVWDFWLNMISPLASRVLYMTTIGNHEADWTNGNTLYGVEDSGGECDVSSTYLLSSSLLLLFLNLPITLLSS